MFYIVFGRIYNKRIYLFSNGCHVSPMFIVGWGTVLNFGGRDLHVLFPLTSVLSLYYIISLNLRPISSTIVSSWPLQYLQFYFWFI